MKREWIKTYKHCHNSIFTPRISSSVGTQNEVVGLIRIRPEKVSNASKSFQNMAGSTFNEVWKGLTNVDQG